MAKGNPRRVYTRVGARPGDPLADLALALCCGSLQVELEHSLCDQGFLLAVEVPAGRLFAVPGPLEVVDVLPANYVISSRRRTAWLAMNASRCFR